MIAGHHTMLAPTGAPPAAQRCVVLDGASYALNTAVGAWTTTNQGSLSMACWVWISGLPASGPVSVLTLEQPNADNGAQLDPISSATRKFRVLFQSSAFIGPTEQEVGGIGAWHHYAFSYDYGTKAFAGYVDGTQVLTSTPNRWLSARATLGVSLGVRNSGVATAGKLNGKIANANIYLRALSSAEVTALAAFVDAIPDDADHQWAFANDDFADTGTAATKWNLTGYGNPTFEDVT